MCEIDLTDLPEQAKQELLDFYAFLKMKYGIYRQHSRPTKQKFEDFLANPSNVDKMIKYMRDELHER